MKILNIVFLSALGVIIIGLILVGGSSAASYSLGGQAANQNTSKNVIDVQLDHKDKNLYFDVTNIFPGEKGSSVIYVKNSGKSDFHYVIDLALTGKLAEGPHPLMLSVFDEHGQSIDPSEVRALSAGQTEALTIVWKMPNEAGNEYQNTTASLDLYVRAAQSTVLAAQ